MDYIKRLPLGTTPLPFNTAPAAAGYRRMHRIEPFRSKQKNSILRDMYLQNYFEEKESLTNLVSKAILGRLRPKKWFYEYPSFY